MRPDLYTAVVFAAATVLTLLGIVLLGISIRIEERTVNLRLARGFLALAYFMLALPSFVSFFYEGRANPMYIEIITPAVSTIQSTFFTFTILTILLPTDITRRQIVWHAAIVIGALILYFVTAFNLNNYRCAVNIGVTAYLCLLIFYTWLFIKKYATSLRKLEDYYDEDEQGRLKWVKNSFYAALSIGILASVATYFPLWMRVCFIFTYLLFYTWFVIRFSNYVTKIDFYLSATTRKAELIFTTPRDQEDITTERSTENDPVNETELKKALEKWVLDEGYIKGDVSTEEIARALGTNLLNLRSYFHDYMSSDFRTWRNELRIRKAQELIADHPDMSLNQIAIQVGFVTRSNFYLYFKKITGQSPADYRDQIAANK
ncbi:MAG: AraC family transcriptional regulator [Bacteroidales bacterium]|jgi:AraC-like DNA-binding protein|nr:AraC family transcriptional regulator [Bacteroidales bacterium]